MRQINNDYLGRWIAVGLAALLIVSVISLLFHNRTEMNKQIGGSEIKSSSYENPNDLTSPASVLWTIPADGEWNVAIDQSIIIKFNESVPDIIFNLYPDASPYNITWSEFNTNASIQHSSFIYLCYEHNATVQWDDGFGNWLSYSWRFWSICGPYIRATNPSNGSVNVDLEQDIYVLFNEPMDVTSLQFTISPSGLTFMQQWTNNDSIMGLIPLGHFDECILYTMHIITARNKTGGQLLPWVIPNPWSFRVFCIPPHMSCFEPDPGNVPPYSPLKICFSEPMNESTFNITIQPNVIFDSIIWPDNQTVILNHTIPLNNCTEYTLRIIVQSVQGEPFRITPYPYPGPDFFTFRTYCSFSIHNLQVHRIGQDDILLTWTPSPYANNYVVYHSNYIFTLWPWAEITITTNSSVLVNDHLSDGFNHFYIVRGFNESWQSCNSTMGALWHTSFTLSSAHPNTYWFSLPYNTIYSKASDIANELGPTKIGVIAKWNPSKQQSTLYYYTNNNWRGLDFTINPGDGLWIGITGDFDWVINGTDSSIPLQFTYRPLLNSNYYWISLPYANNMDTASKLVLAIEGGLGPDNNTKIAEVGKWNYLMQRQEIFRHSLSGWSGIDFDINIGDSLWIKIVSTFLWTPELITPEAP